MKEKFDIGGMTCSACASHVSKAVNKLNVKSCNVNLLTKRSFDLALSRKNEKNLQSSRRVTSQESL